MQFPESWLRSLVNPPLTSGELAHLLTMAGLEVEALQPVAPAFSGVVVAQVLAVERHPNADKLALCKVDAGQGELLQIVCGAPNVAAGLKVPCALVGAELPGLIIKAAKVRGVESFGMLCSERELGLSEEHGGLMVLPADAPVGQDIRACLELDDRIFTLKLTPNRADCLSLAGIAREVAALTGAGLCLPEVQPAAAAIRDERTVMLDAPAACPRYCGRAVKGIDPRAPTPAWMKTRLARCGIRSISAVVDVTNYVMLELGQPLHAFDNGKLRGGIHVRFPFAGESLLLLNTQTVEPSADTLLIADEAGPVALAGIMGGEESGVTDSTTDLFLESAFFAPEAVAGKARALGFASDASYRFERGVDFAGARRALERATQLILDICGGSAGPVVDACAELPKRQPIRLRPERAAKVLGITLPPELIERLLAGLGLAFERFGPDFVVMPPSWRFDLVIEEDLIEELARIHGYDNIPATVSRAPLTMLPRPEQSRGQTALRRLLAVRDYQEVINFSFVDAQWEADFCANDDPVRLANPIASQMGVMRSSLIGGLVAVLASNRRRRVERARIFEIGRCFLEGDQGEAVPGYAQPLRIAGLAAGPAAPEQWGMPTRAADFFDVKADVEALLAPGEARFQPLRHPALHPGRAATVLLAGRPIGLLGELHPLWTQKYELGASPVVFELELQPLLARDLPRHREVSRYPAVIRDLALVVPQVLPAQLVLDSLRQQAPAIVRQIALFDVYLGQGINEDEKSLAFRVVMQDTQKTLADAEVDAALGVLIDTAVAELGARLRG
jgi:phenylalanyl-tRNA synthetase beta chain